MYINPFAAGVLATIMVELILTIGYALYSATKRK